MKSLRSTEYGSEVSDGDSPPWSGTISVVAPQAAGEAPSGRACTEVVATSNIAAMQHTKLKAYRQRNLKTCYQLANTCTAKHCSLGYIAIVKATYHDS